MPTEQMNYDFREQNKQRYMNYIHWMLNEKPKFQCPECLKAFKTAVNLRLHLTKEADSADIPCTYFTNRYAGHPPFTTLSLDARSFMCNFGCSLVTEDKAMLVKHLIDEHRQELEAWSMSERLMRF